MSISCLENNYEVVQKDLLHLYCLKASIFSNTLSRAGLLHVIPIFFFFGNYTRSRSLFLYFFFYHLPICIYWKICFKRVFFFISLFPAVVFCFLRLFFLFCFVSLREFFCQDVNYRYCSNVF